MLKVEIYLNGLNPEKLALLYVTLNEIGSLAAAEVYAEGLANCGKRDFDWEVARVREQLVMCQTDTTPQYPSEVNPYQ